MQKILCFVCVALVGALTLYAAPWGQKPTVVTATSTNMTVVGAAQHLSVYNAGTSDVAVSYNIGSAAFDLAFTNGALPLLPTVQAMTIDLLPAVGSAQLNKITNVVLRSSSGSNVVYVTTY